MPPRQIHLNSAAKKQVREASFDRISLILSSAKRLLATGRFIQKTNRYGYNTISRLRVDLGARNVNQSHLSLYIASSSIVHLGDGWSYLAHALQSLMRGDSAMARHFAYYAELRAAVSLLATQGIGIFDKQHVVIDQTGNIVVLDHRQGTHTVTWNVLRHWASGRKSWSLISAIVAPDGIALKDWTDTLGHLSFRPVAKRWLTTWGLDLAMFSRDRDARNVSSYRPSVISVREKNLTFEEIMNFVSDIWWALEPGYQRAFGTLDLHLFRLALEASAANIDRVLHEQNLDESRGRRLGSFLTRVEIPNDLAIIKHANTKVDMHAPGDAFGVIARALLLLRMSSGAVTQLMSAAGIDPNEVEFWWNGIAEARGIWHERPEYDIADLWSDVEESVEYVRERMAEDPEYKLAKLSRDGSDAYMHLTAVEKGLIWSMAFGESRP